MESFPSAISFLNRSALYGSCDFDGSLVPPDILLACRRIVCFCEQREYVKANDLYVQMAIGNAPWPIGVTMVGIHARGGRDRINTHKVAHVMNDEMMRKYITSIKRLMTYCQNKYNTDPFKSIG